MSMLNYRKTGKLSVLNSCKTNKKLLIEIDENNENNNCYHQYIIFRAHYAKSDFFPPSYAPIIMKHHFPSSELILPYSENHGAYKMQVGDLLTESVKNWIYNRPPDMVRCPDIARYIYNSKKPIDTMIHLSFNNILGVFEAFDGIHRITALKIIKEENSKPLELLCPGEFGSNNDANWLFKQYIMVNIRLNATEGELIEAFKNLNKSQAVPELYMRDFAKEKRDIIDTIANEWYVKYKSHFSPSSNPQTGNTNRNKFVELLDILYDTLKIDTANVKKLIDCLKNANQECSENIPSNASPSARLRCRETGCYLFLYKNDVLLHKIIG